MFRRLDELRSEEIRQQVDETDLLSGQSENVPRKSIVNTEELLKILTSEEDVLQSEGTVASPSEEIWTKISQLLHGIISPKYVYVFVRENRHGILDKLKKAKGMSKDTAGEDRDRNISQILHHEDEELKLIDSSESDTDSGTSFLEGDLLSSRKFEMFIDNSQWKEMYHGIRNYNRHDRSGLRGYCILEPNLWTSIVVNCIWVQLRLPCAFAFKRAKVFLDKNNRKYFLLIQGRCRECGAELKGVSLNEPEENEGLKLIIYAPDTRNISHSEKCYLSGINRTNIANSLRHEVPSVFRKKEANKLMNLGEPEPPHLYSTNVLRKAKQEKRNLTLNSIKSNDPFKSLEQMKHVPPYIGSIHDIATDKVNIQYWSPSQMYAYKKYCCKKGSRVCIDATGSLVRKVSRPNGSSGPIFLYECVIKNENFQYPVSQMLSEKHDTNTILYWLNEWIRCGAPTPNEIVTDWSRALLGAVAKSFGQSFTLQEYKEKCFSFIMGNASMKPSCFIRLDIAHLIKRVCGWSCFQGKNKRIKDFYVRCIVLMAKCKSIEILAGLLEMTLTVALSETDGTLKGEVKKESPAELSRTRLIALIGDNDIFSELDTSDFLEGQSERYEEDDNKDICLSASIKIWVKDIQHKAEVNSKMEGTRINAYCNEKFVQDLIRIAQDFPLWTAVMVSPMGCPNITASSAIVEGDFADLKTRILKHETTPLAIDKMVAIHLQCIEGSVKIATALRNIPIENDNNEIKGKDNETNNNFFSSASASMLSNQLNQSENMSDFPKKISSDLPDNPSDEEENEEGDELQFIENWRGMVKPLKKRKTYYMDPFPELQVAHSVSISKIPGNILLKNGNISGNIKLENTMVRLNNTCPFDSVCQCLIVAYIDSETYRNDIKIANLKEPNDVSILKLVQLIASSGITRKAYELRYRLLSEITEANIQQSGLEVIECEGNVGVISAKLLINDLSVIKREQCSVDNCANKKQTEVKQPVTVIDHNIFLDKGLQTSVEKAFDERLFPCKEPCSGPIISKLIPKSHLLLDIEFLGAAVKSKKFRLNEFPIDLSGLGVGYRLFAIIAYIPSPHLGHYVAYCRRGNGEWQVYNDLAQSVNKTSDETEVLAHMCFYARK